MSDNLVNVALVGPGIDYLNCRGLVNRILPAKIRAVVDSNLEQADRIGKAVGAAIVVPALTELLKQHADAIDAVVVHQRHQQAASLAEVAVRAGKHVLVESPQTLLGTNEAVLSDQGDEASRCLMIGQHLRFASAIVVVKNSVRSGKLGDLGLVRMHSWRRGESSKDAGSVSIDGEYQPIGANKIWREIDLATWLFAELPTVVFAVGRKLKAASSDSYDFVQLHLGFPGGGMALIDWSFSNSTTSGYFSLSAIGSRGAAYADDHHNSNLVIRGDTARALEMSHEMDDIAVQLKEFGEAIQEQRPAVVSADDVRPVLQIVETMNRSLELGKALKRNGGEYEFV